MAKSNISFRTVQKASIIQVLPNTKNAFELGHVRQRLTLTLIFKV